MSQCVEKRASGRVVVRMLTLGYAAAPAGVGSVPADGLGCPGHSRCGSPAPWGPRGAALPKPQRIQEQRRARLGVAGSIVRRGVRVSGSSGASPGHGLCFPPSSASEWPLSRGRRGGIVLGLSVCC